MKFCPSCGAELKEGAKFCASCGFQIQIQEQAPPPPVQAPQQTFEPREATNAFTDAITGKTNIIQRVINILTKPKLEWPVINNEQPNIMKLIFGYAFILALIPAIASFVSFGLIGTTVMGYTYRSVSSGIMQALTQLISGVLGVYLLTWVIDLLAPSFDSTKNFGKSLQLAVYSYTASWVAGILLLIPGVRWLSFLVGLYSIYLLVIGTPVMKNTPKEKVAGYVIVTFLVMIAISFLLALILGAILGIFFIGSGGFRGMGL